MAAEHLSEKDLLKDRAKYCHKDNIHPQLVFGCDGVNRVCYNLTLQILNYGHNVRA